jgi:hypothetical protein
MIPVNYLNGIGEIVRNQVPYPNCTIANKDQFFGFIGEALYACSPE